MKKTSAFLILAIAVVGIYGASELPTSTSAPALPVIPTTTAPPPPPTTTLATTTPATTSTPSQPPSTSSSTTEASTTTSTTPAPTTSTVPSTSTTTPKPEPPQKPEVGKWALEQNNKTCIIVQLATQLVVNYTTTDNKTNEYVFNVPKKTKAPTGSCGKGTEDQHITIEFGGENVTSGSMDLTFHLNDTKSQFELSKAAFVLTDVPNAKDKQLFFYHVGSNFSTPKEMSYHCTKEQVLNLTTEEQSTAVIGKMHISKVQLEAFHTKEGQQFSTASDCDAINTPDIVPIAVGIALIALVVVVLIAYLVARRRANARGYVSM